MKQEKLHLESRHRLTGEVRKVDVSAVIVGSLAVHVFPGAYGRTVTHIRTGLKVAGEFDSKRQAMKCARRLDAMKCWEFDCAAEEGAKVLTRDQIAEIERIVAECRGRTNARATP